jgi:hypothetical protein
MGSFEVETLRGEPIVIARFGADYNMKADFSKSRAVIGEAFAKQSTPFYYILNISASEFDFSQMTARLAALTDAKTGPYRHPLLKEVIFVTEDELGIMAADAIQQDQYGEVQSKLYKSEEEAIEYVRSLVDQTIQQPANHE